MDYFCNLAWLFHVGHRLDKRSIPEGIVSEFHHGSTDRLDEIYSRLEDGNEGFIRRPCVMKGNELTDIKRCLGGTML